VRDERDSCQVHDLVRLRLLHHTQHCCRVREIARVHSGQAWNQLALQLMHKAVHLVPLLGERRRNIAPGETIDSSDENPFAHRALSA
jgi:hypothetical protein